MQPLEEFNVGFTNDQIILIGGSEGRITTQKVHIRHHYVINHQSNK